MRSRRLRRLVAAACVAAACASSAMAAIQTRPLNFAKGATSATVSGTIKGDTTVDYKVRARAGQTLTVDLRTTHAATYFNVLPPGSRDVAIFVGSTGGNHWSGALPADGEYTLRVYLMRSAARRAERATYTLEVGLAGAAREADRKVGSTPYHATGQVPCSMGAATPGGTPCEFGVVRQGPGRATVYLKPPGGFERVLAFDGDKVSAPDGATVRASRSGDTWTVDVNDFEHFLIPEAVISGG